MSSSYREVYDRWKSDPIGFWKAAQADIDWFVPATEIYRSDIKPYGRWFADGVCNTCHNAVDRHVDGGRGEQAAIIYDSAVTGTKRSISYAELLGEVQACALMLEDFGVKRGDCVLLYMPMVPEALFGMLDCARIGAVHSVVFGGFAAPELATRIDDAKPRVVLSASCGIEGSRVIEYKPLLDKAIELAKTKPDACVIFQRSQSRAKLILDRDHDWQASTTRKAAELRAGRKSDCVRLAATDPLYILYTSGTTGQPKGIVRDNGGHLVAMRWTMSAIYGMSPGETFWAASDVGWVVGHSYITYGPLITGCTTILYEGKPVGTPDAGAFWRVISEHGVKVLFTAPTAIRAIRKEDPGGKLRAQYDLKGFRALFLAGERADPETVRWSEETLGVPVIDHWWQTETGWSIAANPIGLGMLTIKHGSPSVPMPGYDVEILDAEGRSVPAGEMGEIALKLPLPPGAAVTLWNANDRFQQSYLSRYSGYFNTADAGYLDEDGYIWVLGRTDDVINVAGHRLSTGAMEEVILSHSAVAECAVVGCKDELKGELPCGLIVPKSGINVSPDVIGEEIVAMVRQHIGPVAALKRVIAVDRLPKTRSGKILRSTIKRIMDGEPVTIPSTIEDPAVLHEIGSVVKK
ncbi:propionyl-CoA synthetase [Bradyrhizobium sp. Arg237L]|uniref:propionyl-CoA synthetase n=1 Tax=Bradyrhizobium sp. Arg237L TaxID=3003352 RepID=UPI00249E4422|nr:propionyl-CoA synthetase [Bradyrhizobium sp. Arg237L]MDI4236493.1 propionyl-CoA synthetase [Bradyrhizobium sp. Arg237L]